MTTSIIKNIYCRHRNQRIWFAKVNTNILILDFAKVKSRGAFFPLQKGVYLDVHARLLTAPFQKTSLQLPIPEQLNLDPHLMEGEA